MATLRSYSSIRKPSVSVFGKSGGTSFSSIAKKQLAAEDAIYDTQYEDGLLSPETYKAQLSGRLSRVGLTPLQQFTIQDKIKTVDEKVLDTRYEQAYANDQITTTDYQAYQKVKLDKMTADGSPAYIKQFQKVQELADKVQRESRTQFRVQENLRISKLPDDNSASLYQKAQLYTTLAQQARLDGDEQQAQTFETQANNYISSAKRADVNDLITSARLGTSQTPSGIVDPTAEGGAELFASLGGGKIAANSPQVRNALESLDRDKKTLDRLYQQAQDRDAMIAAYQNAVNRASGDQKTSLQIQLNNLIDGKAQLENQISQTTANVQEKVNKVQEVRAGLAASAFSTEARKTDLLFQRDEDNLEKNFASGKINREEYVKTAIDLLERKRQFYDEVSTGFSSLGKEDRADSYLQKLVQADGMSQNYSDVRDNPDDYEVISSDPGGKLTNISGKPTKKGELVLTNVRQQKDDGTLDTNYVNINGVFHRIYYPATNSEVTGLPNTRAWNKDLGVLQNNAFVYVNGQKQAIKQVQAPDDTGKFENKLMLESDIKKEIDAKRAIQEGNTYRIKTSQELAPETKKGGFLQNLFQGVKKGVESMGKTNILGGYAIPSATPKTSQQTQKFIDSNVTNNLLSGARNILGSALSRFTPKAYASQAVPDTKDPDNIERIKAALESEGILDENTLAYALATVDHETAGQFKPVNEGFFADQGVAPGTTGRAQAIKRGYSGGDKYYGRGYIQLTHDYNYKAMDKRLGLNGELVRNPELANDPEIAAKILAAYFKDRGVAAKASQGKFYEARKPINGYDKAKEIASKAVNYTQRARDLLTTPPVEQDEGQQSNPLQTILGIVAPKAYASSPSGQLRSSTPSVSNQSLRSSSPMPSLQPIQTAQSSAQLRSTPARQSTPIKMPTISLPKITAPSLPKPVQNIVSTVQRVAAPVVNTVKNVIGNIGKTLSNLNPFRRK